MATLPQGMLDFLADLAQNNDRDWFTANKKRYEAQVKAPALAFIEAFGEPLHGISPHFLAVPKAQGGSLFRIYRDTRFSRDKTPYKTHTGMQFRHRDASRDVHAPGFYLHIAPGGCGVGAGIWQPPNPVLGRVRDRIVADPDAWSTLRAHLAEAALEFMHTDGALMRVPRGYPKDHPHADDLRLKTIAVWQPLADAQVTAPTFVHDLARSYASGAPLVRFLCEAVGLPF